MPMVIKKLKNNLEKLLSNIYPKNDNVCWLSNSPPNNTSGSRFENLKTTKSFNVVLWQWINYEIYDQLVIKDKYKEYGEA